MMVKVIRESECFYKDEKIIAFTQPIYNQNLDYIKKNWFHVQNQQYSALFSTQLIFKYFIALYFLRPYISMWLNT